MGVEGGGGGQGGCERRIEVFVKIKQFFLGGGGVRVGLGGQGGCEGRFENSKKIGGVGGGVGSLGGQGVRWGVRVDVNVELKFL